MAQERVIVSVRVYEARHLPQADAFSESDPYIQLVWGDEVVRSPAVQDDPNPKWEALSLGIEGELNRSHPSGDLRLEVWDHDTITADDLMASVSVPLADIVKAGHLDQTFALELAPGMKARGDDQLPEIRVRLAVIPALSRARDQWLGEAGEDVTHLSDRNVIHVDLPDAVGPYGLELGYTMANARLSLVRFGYDETDHPLFVDAEGAPLPQRFHLGMSIKTGMQSELRTLIHPLVDGDFERIQLRRYASEVAFRSSVLETIEAVRGESPRHFTFKAVAKELERVKDVVILPEKKRIYVPYAPASDGEISLLSLSFIQVGKVKLLSRTILQLELYEPLRRRVFAQFTDDNRQRLPQEIQLDTFEVAGYTFGQRLTLREVDVAQLPLARIIIERRKLDAPRDTPLAELF